MKISVILAFLLSWSFVSSNPHHEQSDNKSVGELNNANDRGSDSSNLAGTKSTDDASSGIDWGGDSLNYLSGKGLGDIDENGHADNKLFPLALISEILKTGKGFIYETVGGIKKLIETLISRNKLSGVPLSGNDLSDSNNNENIITWVQKNVEGLVKLLTDREHEHTEAMGSAFVDEETEKHGVRAKRELKTSSSGLLWGDPRKGGISGHILKLSEGSTSNVLKSEKATVAEALNGRAIRKILAQARAKAAKAARRKKLYDNDDFNKWLWASLDTNIFNRPSFDAKIAGQRSKTENTDDSRHRAFSISHRGSSEPMNNHHHHHHEMKHKFNTLSDSGAYVDNEYPRIELSHKSKHRERLSPKLQFTSGEKHDRIKSGVSRDTVHDTHGLSYYEDAESNEDASLRARAPHARFRITQDETTGNAMPNWEHAKRTRAGSSRAQTSHWPRSAKSREFETSKEREEYNKRFIFRRMFDTEREGADDETVYTGKGRKISGEVDTHGKIKHNDPDDKETIATSNSRGNSKLGHKRYRYGIGDQEHSVYGETDAVALNTEKNRHLTDSLVERTASFDLNQEENIRKKNNERYNVDGVQRSTISPATSAETGTEGPEGVKRKQSGNALVMNISTGTPKRKAANIDIEHYHSRDQNAGANAATSSLSSLSDENGNKRTNNVHALPSVNDGSAVVERKAVVDDRSVLGRTRDVIDNDATSTGIEMGFGGIKNHPPVDLPSVHSSLSRAHLDTHLEKQKVRHSVNEYQHSIANTHNVASSKRKKSMDGSEDERLKYTKTRETSSAEGYENSENYDVKGDQEITGNAAPSAETPISFTDEHQYDLLRISPSGNSGEENYTGTGKKYADLKGNRRTTARHKTSIEVINIDDRSGEVYIPRRIPEFSIPKFKKGHPLHRTKYEDSDSEEMRNDRVIGFDDSFENLRESEIDYDGLGEEGKFAVNDEMPEESIMTIFNEHRSRGQHNQRMKPEYGKQGQRDHHSKHNRHNQHNHHAFNERVYNATSTSTASNTTEFGTWNKYLRFIRQREGNESNASLEASTSAIKKSMEENNGMDEEISSLDRRGKQHTADEDNYILLKKRPIRGKQLIIKNVPGSARDTHSIDINEITSSKGREGEGGEEEGEIKNKKNINNQGENSKTVTLTENLIYDDSTDTKWRASSNEEASNNNIYSRQSSWKSLSSENSRADVQTGAERVYDAHKRNEDINMMQSAETQMESIDPKSNLQSAETSSSSRSYAESQTDSEYHVNELNNSKNIVAKTQTSDEKIFSDDVKDRYRDENFYKTSISCKSTDQSEMETEHRSREGSKSDSHEIGANAKTLTETVSSTDEINRSRSNIHNKIASSKSLAGLQTGSERHLNNMRGNKIDGMNAEASAGATASVSDRQEYVGGSRSEDTSSFSKSSVEAKARIENSLNYLKNIQMNAVNSGISSSSKSFAESETNNEQESDNFKNVRLNSANSGASSTAILSDIVKNERSMSTSNLSEESQAKTNLINHKGNRINAISKASAEAMSSNAIKDEHRSHLPESFSSSRSISSEGLQAKSQRDPSNIQNSQTNVDTAESSIKSTIFDNAKSVHWSDSSESSSSSKSLENAYVRNKYNSHDSTEIQRNNIEHRSELESASSSTSHVKSRIETEDNSSAIEDNEINIGNAETLSETTSSVRAKNRYQFDSQNQSSFSRSSAESQAKNEQYSDNMIMNHKQNIDVTSKVGDVSSIIKENHQRELSSFYTSAESQIEDASTSTTISDTVVNDTGQRKLLHPLLSSQNVDKSDLNSRKDDPQIAENIATLTSTDINDDNRRHEDEKTKAKWLIDPANKNDIKKFTNNESIEEGKALKEDSGDALSAAASIKAVTDSADIKNMQNLITELSSTDAKVQIHSDSSQKEEVITDNSAISGISATSRTSNEIKDNHENELLKISFLSDLRGTREKKEERDIDITKDSWGSMATAKSSSESMVSSSNEQNYSRKHLAKETSPGAFKGKVFGERQNNHDVSKGKSVGAISKTTMETTSNYVDNVYRDGIPKNATSAVSYDKIRIDDKFRGKTGVSTSVDSSDTAILQNIEHRRRNGSPKVKSSYDTHDKKHMEDRIDSKVQVKSMKDANSVNEMMGIKSRTFNNINNENRNNLLKVTSSDNLHTEMAQRDKHKSDILSENILFDETAATGTTSYDDKRERAGSLRKVIFLNDPREIRTKHEGNYNIPKKLIDIGDNKEFKEGNLGEMMPSAGIQVGNKNIQNISKKDTKDDVLISMETIDNTNSLKNDCQDDPLAISDINTHDKRQHEVISSILTKNELINSDINTRNSINEWHTGFQETASQSSYVESWDKKETAMKTDVSTESTANGINKGAYRNDAVQEKSLIIPSIIVQVGEEDNYGDQRADVGNTVKAMVSAEISNSNISPIECQNDVKEDTSIASQLKQHDLNIQDRNRVIASNILSTEDTGSSEMQNARLDSLETGTSSNSHTETQRKNINSILKESLEEIATGETISARTMSSEKIESESREKLIRDPSKSGSRTKLQIENKKDSNVSQEEQITANVETDCADSNDLANIGRNDPIRKTLLSDSDMYREKENRNVLRSDIANAADVTTSAKEASNDVIKDERQNGVTMTGSLFNSRAKARTEHEHNSGIQRESIGTTSSSHVEARTVEGKNTVNNFEGSTKVATDIVASAEATSSSNVEDIGKRESSKILSSINPYTESQTGDAHSLNIVRDNQEATNVQALTTSLTSASADNQVRRKNSSVKKISHADPRDIRMIRTENNDRIDDEGVATWGQATSFNDLEIGHQDNLLKMISSVNSLANKQTKSEHESDILKKRHFISTNTMASSDSKDFADSKHKNNLEELIATSSNSYAKSSAEDENRANVLKNDHTDVLGASTSAQTISDKFRDTKGDKSHRITLSSGSYADAQVKDEGIENIKKATNAIVGAKKETISSTDIKDPHDLFDLLAATKKMQPESKKIFQEDIFEGSITGSSDFSSSAQIESARDSRILKDYHESSATVDTTTKTRSSNQRDRQKDLHKTGSLSSGAQGGGQRDLIESTSSAGSYVAARATSENIAKGEKAKEDREVIVNVSTLGKAEAYNEVKGARPSDWLVTTSGAGALAEERAQNKDKFNVLREVEEVAVYAGTSTGPATPNNIEDERHDIRAEDPSGCQDGSDVARKIQDVAVIPDASSEVTATKGIKNRSENKGTLNNDMTASSSKKARVKMQIESEENDGVSNNSGSLVNIEDTRSSVTSAVSSISTYDDTDMDLSAKYEQINDGTSATSAIIPVSKETHLSSVKTTSSHPSYRISKCDDDIETRRFISEATNLYQVLDKQRDSEILLMKKNPTGPVQIADLKSSVPPLIAYRLIPREVYDRIRAIIANKQISCTDCPLSNA